MARPRQGRHWVATTLKVVIGIVVGAWSLIPVYWVFVVAFSTPAALRRVPAELIPSAVTFDNFVRLFDASSGRAEDVIRGLTNSFILAGGTTVLTVLIALPAAYAFARLSFRGSAIALTLITVTFAVPVYLVLIPLFQLLTHTRLINTHQGVIIVMVSAAMPLSVWILRSHIAGLPSDIEDAARVDGAGTGTILTQIILPLMAPGIVAAAVVTFLGAWGGFLIPLLYSNSPATQPLTLLIPQFATRFSSDYGLQAAAGVIGFIIPVIVVLLLQKRLIAGLLTGASR